MGIGGSVCTKGQPYRIAFEECIKQLAEFGKAESHVWHLFPIVSGRMADSFLRVIREQRLTHHCVIGVLTADVSSLRLFVRLKYLRKRHIRLVERPRMSFPEYRSAAGKFFERTGVCVDPNHTVYAVRVLDDLPAFVRPEDRIVFWITCPFIHESEFRNTCERAPI
jgi:hypothetical protein